MPTTAQLTHPPGQAGTPWHIVPPLEGSGVANRPTWGEMLAERAPIIGAPAFYGPPAIVVFGPWLLLVLLLVGPFVLILTLLLVLGVAAGLLTVLAGVIASPYLLVRHLRAHAGFHAKAVVPRRLFKKHRASPGRLGSIQPKGVS